MDDSVLQSLRDPEIIGVRERHFERLAAFFRRDIRNQPFFLCGIQSMFSDSPTRNPRVWEAKLEEGLTDLASKAALARDPRTCRPLFLCWDPHGVHFVDELFGARPYVLDGGWQAEALSQPVGSLVAPDLEACVTWCEVRSFTRRFLDLRLDAVTLALPTIASPLNVAVNLYGQRIIVAMMLEPDAARRDLRVITGVLCALHRWYIDHVPFEHMQCIAAPGRSQPRGFGQICGCTTQLLSPRVYTEFIAPLDEEILSLYPHGGMIHLCGAHTQHLPAWRDMEGLRAVQMNDRAVEDLQAYHRELRDDQVLYANPSGGMPVERILELTNGGDRTVIPALPPDPGDGAPSADGSRQRPLLTRRPRASCGRSPGGQRLPACSSASGSG